MLYLLNLLCDDYKGFETFRCPLKLLILLPKWLVLYIAKAHKQGTIKRCKPFGTIITKKSKNTTEMKKNPNNN